RYEGLRQDPLTNLQTIFEFAGLPASEQELLDIIDALSIDKVKQKGEGQHIRKGVIGGWKSELTADDIETCNQLAGPLLEKLGYFPT
ncbi:MAG: sulfotransferase domain-containing protein, partial [Phormidesmis sp.]